MDATDLRILSLLQSRARIPNATIARAVGLAPSAALGRVRRLEKRGVIRGYEARIHAPAVGAGLAAFVFVKADERVGSATAGRILAKIPEVLEVHSVAGDDCYLVKVRVADTEALARLLRERLGKIGTIRQTRTTIVLGTLKESAQLPIPRQDRTLA
jgi:Lrp/AsnC family leucine-responsive transcriptional regulator